MTYLELCRFVARESGAVVGGGEPLTTVVDQPGRVGKVAAWVASAWEDVQTERNDWFWMEAEFQGSTVAGTDTYAGAAFSLTRHANWIYDEGGDTGMTAQDASLTKADEAPLIFLPWRTFRETRLRGVIQSGRPVYFSVDRAGALRLSPNPDKAYTLRGQYRKTPQTLAADADTPEAPAQHHKVIAWRALADYSGVHDEAGGQIGEWRRQATSRMADLLRDQTPKVRFAPPMGFC